MKNTNNNNSYGSLIFKNLYITQLIILERDEFIFIALLLIIIIIFLTLLYIFFAYY